MLSENQGHPAQRRQNQRGIFNFAIPSLHCAIESRQRAQNLRNCLETDLEGGHEPLLECFRRPS
jgi:hypothetical protein